MEVGPVGLDRRLIGCERGEIAGREFGILDRLDQVAPRLVDRRLGHVGSGEQGIEISLGLGGVGTAATAVTSSLTALLRP